MGVWEPGGIRTPECAIGNKTLCLLNCKPHGVKTAYPRPSHCVPLPVWGKPTPASFPFAAPVFDASDFEGFLAAQRTRNHGQRNLSVVPIPTAFDFTQRHVVFVRQQLLAVGKRGKEVVKSGNHQQADDCTQQHSAGG